MTNWPPLAVTAIGMWGLRQSRQLAYLLSVFVARRAEVCLFTLDHVKVWRLVRNARPSSRQAAVADSTVDVSAERRAGCRVWPSAMVRSLFGVLCDSDQLIGQLEISKHRYEVGALNFQCQFLS